MNIGIIDGDLIYNKKHRFPNLACMKISGYYKSKGHNVELLTDYGSLTNYDLVFISKVFTETKIPEEVLNLPFVTYGGTGFFYDKSEPLPDYIEHCMPDYHLYDKWVQSKIKNGEKKREFSFYTDYSIGYTTRGCIRHCSFCVNKNYNASRLHSPVSEFLDETRPYICLLDDSILACADWKKVFDDLIATGKRFQFRQGVDERLLTEEKCEYLFRKAKYANDRSFAFDNIKDKELIISKLKMIRKYTDERIKFYLLCAYNHDKNGVYDEIFWKQDIIDLFERIKILAEYACLPYIMRFENYKESKYKGIYINAAAWCNQANMFRKMTFSEFCKKRGMSKKGIEIFGSDYIRYENSGMKKGAAWRYLDEFSADYPDIADKYFNFSGDS